MTVLDEPLKDLFARLPVWARHSISLTTLGVVLTMLFFVFVREPIAAAAESDRQQDGKIEKLESAQTTLTATMNELAQAQAVGTSERHALAQAQIDIGRRLDRIEDKIDKLRQGR